MDNNKPFVPTVELISGAYSSRLWDNLCDICEIEELTANRNRLKQRYISLKDEVKEAEQIRKSVYSILRQEQREQQPCRTQGMEL